MRKLTISDFKTNSFDITQSIEKLSLFDLKDPKRTLLDILEASNDCDSIIEAIFYKKEKMKRGLDSQKEKILEELCIELQNEIENIRLSDNKNSISILEQRKLINELCRIKKILVYSIQMENQAELILDALIKSDDIDEWRLLAELIYAHTTFSKSIDLGIFITYSKKLEKRISETFETSIHTGDTQLSKACFEILAILDKEFCLIDEFLVIKNLFTSKMTVHPPMISKINLGSKENDTNTFTLFLKETEKIISDNYDFICLIFGQDDEYIDYIISKIYRTLISINLGNFLNVSNPPIFLISFQTAFEAVNAFGSAVGCLFQKFDYNSCAIDIFSGFLFTAALKEKQIFDEIFETYMNGSKSINTYSISGSKVEKSNDYLLIYQKLLTIIEAYITRGEKLYSKEIQKDILESFSNRLCLLVEKMTIKYKSKINLIQDLIYLHVSNCKLFKDKGESLSNFNKKLKEAIETEFENLIHLSTMFLRGEISNLFFNHPDCHINLRDYLKKLFESQGLMGEKNFKLMTFKITTSLYEFLYKQLQLININEENSKRISNAIDDLFICIPIACSSSFVPKFNHLKSLIAAVTLKQTEFEELLTKNKNLFNESELKFLRKARSKKPNKGEDQSKNK